MDKGARPMEDQEIPQSRRIADTVDVTIANLLDGLDRTFVEESPEIMAFVYAVIIEEATARLKALFGSTNLAALLLRRLSET